MGRALFSTIYTQGVAVRTEPGVPDQSDRPRCEKWSISNPFDPDSDEFYEDATREVFTDTEAWRQEQEAVRELLVAQARGGTESSSSSEASEGDSGSPMAVGSDDPALLIADAFSGAAWRSQLIAIGASPDWAAQIRKPHPSTFKSFMLNTLGPVAPAAEAELRSQLRATRRSSAAFVPPSAFRAPADSTELGTLAAASPPQSPTFRRTVTITPISIPNEPSSPSPPSPATPSTPTDNVYEHAMSSLLTPSPPPSVTPHVYTWRSTPLAAQASPLANLSNSAGPLTNPSARLSFVRLNVAPTRVQNTAV
ncbi:hypothetical protein C0995_016553 [Termitomyces sp. Mi166|nr:hypothetical protein C0995_016553 [Termitomyces sp. Mi166\